MILRTFSSINEKFPNCKCAGAATGLLCRTRCKPRDTWMKRKTKIEISLKYSHFKGPFKSPGKGARKVNSTIHLTDKTNYA